MAILKKQQIPLTLIIDDEVNHLSFTLNTQDPFNMEIIVTHNGQNIDLLMRLLTVLKIASIPQRTAEGPATYHHKTALPRTTEPDNIRLIDQAKQILLADLQKIFSLKQLAYQVGTNPTKLSRLFQQHLGMTVFDFLREQRLLKAQDLLRQSSLSIQQVADSIGYKNHSDFTVAFKQRFGTTPRQYRCQFVDNLNN